MKKLLTLLLILPFVVACSDDKEKEGEPDKTDSEFKELIIGTWNVTAYKTLELGEYQKVEADFAHFIFNQNNTFEYKHGDYNITGIYDVKDEIITTSFKYNDIQLSEKIFFTNIEKHAADIRLWTTDDMFYYYKTSKK